VDLLPKRQSLMGNVKLNLGLEHVHVLRISRLALVTSNTVHEFRASHDDVVASVDVGELRKSL
jgi:hypothetical protein